MASVNAPLRAVGVACALLVASGCAAHKPPAATHEPSMTFVATAYCHGTTTAAGVRVRSGIVAADPAVLPLGTVIRIEHAGRYDGAYTVFDTGPGVRGRRVDVFMRDCREAVKFGRRRVRVLVVTSSAGG